MASLSERLEESWKFADEKIGGLNTIQKIGVIFDSAWEKFVHGANKVDYFQYGFYYKNRHGRDEFITIGKCCRVLAACNPVDKWSLLADKAQFIKLYKDFLGRDAMDMATVTKNEFDAFVSKHDKMFIKPAGGTYGRGVSIEPCGDNVDNDALYERLKGESIVAEEVITQHPELEKFNASSLNSLRVVTLLCADGVVRILPGATIRLGREGRIADNFHHNGITAQIDIKTGVTCSMAIDKAGNRYVSHPDSDINVVGFKVPMWDEVCETVKAAALVCPDLRYIGWDVAVTADNRVVIVEGNERADPDVGQMSDGIGKWPVYKPYIEEIEKLNAQKK